MRSQVDEAPFFFFCCARAKTGIAMCSESARVLEITLWLLQGFSE
jgi:hypothetical protein